MQNIFDQLEEYILVINKSGEIIYINPKVVDQLGTKGIKIENEDIEKIIQIPDYQHMCIYNDKGYSITLNIKAIETTWGLEEAYIIIGKNPIVGKNAGAEFRSINRYFNMLYNTTQLKPEIGCKCKILTNLMKDIISDLGALAVVVGTYNQDISEITICATSGEVSEFLQENQRIKLPDKYFEKVEAIGSYNRILKIEELKNYNDEFQESIGKFIDWNKTEIAYIGRYIIKFEEEILGILVITYDKEWRPRCIHDRIIRALCIQIATLMKNISLLEATQAEIAKRKEIEEQNKVLEEAVQLGTIRNELFANVSHEFKTPINIILATMQLLTKYNQEGKIRSSIDVDLNKYLRLIKQNSYRLLKLVSNLVDMSKIDAGYYELKLGNYNIINVIEEITLSVVQYIEGKGINLIFDTDIEECLMACDIEKIERIMLNLLSNAVKYIKEGGEILVDVTKQEDKIIVTVQDNGIGIPEEKLSRIFERYEQAHDTFGGRIEGSGIGLSLVRSLVNMHGGEIWVESQDGQGSAFTFEIPIKDIVNVQEAVHQYTVNHVEKCQIEFADIYEIS